MSVGALLAIGFVLMLIGLMMGWGKPPDDDDKKGKHRK